MLKSILTADEHKSLDKTLGEQYKATSDGNFVLDTDIREHPDTLSLRNALHAERDEKSKLSKNLKAFDGIDPNEIERLKREKEAAQRELNLKSGDIDKIISDATLDVNKKLATALRERDDAQVQIRKYAINDAAFRAITDAGGDPELLLPKVLTVADLENGKAVIRGEDGKPLLARGWKNVDDYKSLNEYVSDLKADARWAVAFKANGARGSSAQPSVAPTTRTVSVTQAPSGLPIIG